MPPRLPPPKGVVLRAERWAHNNTPGNRYKPHAVKYSYVKDGVRHYKNRSPQDPKTLKELRLQASLNPQVLRNYTCFTWSEARRKLGFSLREMAIVCRLHGVSGFRTARKDKRQAATACFDPALEVSASIIMERMLALERGLNRGEGDMTEESGRGSGTGSGRCSAHGERNGERKALTPEQALEIFRRRCDSKAHSTLLAETAEEFGVTQTSIRHIWGRQTWKSTTMPLWTQEERASSRSDSLCQQCLNGGRTDIEQACPACPINRKRGRPVGTKDSYKRHRTSASDVSQLVEGGGVEGLQLAGGGGVEGSRGPKGNSCRLSGTIRMPGNSDSDELRKQPSAASGAVVRIRGTLAVAGRGLYVTDACQVLLDLYHECEIGLQGQSLLLFLLPASAQQVCHALNIALETGAKSQATSHMLLPARSGCKRGSFLPCSMHATPKAHRRGELIISVELQLLTQTDESPGARHTLNGGVHRRQTKLDAHPHEEWTIVESKVPLIPKPETPNLKLYARNPRL